MRIALTNYSPFIDEIAAAAAKTCHADQCIDKDDVTESQVQGAVDYINDVGHYSVLEHNIFTWMVDDISRVCSHQIVRHRHGSYSQQSHRLFKEKSFRDPSKSIASNPEALEVYDMACDRSYEDYNTLVEMGIPEEEARDVLSQRISTSMYISYNVSEMLQSFVPQRTCERAQREVNSVAYAMLASAKLVAPVTMESAGPPCTTTGCREKEKTKYCKNVKNKMKAVDLIVSYNRRAFEQAERGRYVDIPLDTLDLAYDVELKVRKI